jgi:transposase
MSDKDEKPHSRLRDFLIPDAKNTLESASHRHLRGDFEAAEQYLNSAKNKIDRCLQQLQQDKQERQDAEGRENGN